MKQRIAIVGMHSGIGKLLAELLAHEYEIEQLLTNVERLQTNVERLQSSSNQHSINEKSGKGKHKSRQWRNQR